MKTTWFALLILIFAAYSCKVTVEKQTEEQVNLKEKFNPNSLIVPDNNATKLKGQVLYLPLYSNIPYHSKNRLHDLSGFVAIHNTDFYHSITISKVLYFNNDGLLVKDFLVNKKDTITPLATKHYFVPESDKSGTGANFVVEWVSDSLVNEPLIESVMISLTSGQGISFLSKGKVLREMK
jgi:hypothetical protein